MARDRDQARRQAAASERERRRLYVEGRKAEAAATAAALQARVPELDSVLTTGIHQEPRLAWRLISAWGPTVDRPE